MVIKDFVGLISDGRLSLFSMGWSFFLPLKEVFYSSSLSFPHLFVFGLSVRVFLSFYESLFLSSLVDSVYFLVFVNFVRGFDFFSRTFWVFSLDSEIILGDWCLSEVFV